METDVLIVGAGLSGIGAAAHLVRRCPQIRFELIEARERLGGTWDLFRYPGIRSDSSMYTFSYGFKPWIHDKAIADGKAILSYLVETARDYGIDQRIRYHHRLVSANWSSQDCRWLADVELTQTGERIAISCRFLWVCAGYYDYEQGYLPQFDGIESFCGQIVHPQHWPDDADYRDKNVIIIGSGATAVTLLPSMADKAKHVTMLQRSPSWVVGRPERDPLAQRLKKWLPARWVYRLARWKEVGVQLLFYRQARKRPHWARRFLLKQLRLVLPASIVSEHFTPSYNPWDQRICAVPDDDLFKALQSGKASVVTDQIDRFTSGGIRLKSGRELQADMIVTATGLNLKVLGGAQIAVDGAPVVMGQAYNYKGVMLSGVPNMAFVVGYTNSSWTLKADLVSAYVCKLLRYMGRRGYDQVVPRVQPGTMRPAPLIDFQSGYVLRALDKLPKQGDRLPWKLHQNYIADSLLFGFGRVEDGVLEFSSQPGSMKAAK